MVGPVSDQSRPLDQIRIDRWLWAARFYKTRSRAKIAIVGGKIVVNGAKAKPSREVRVCDNLSIRRGNDEIDIVVVALSDQRGPANVAQALYSETPESIERRAELKAQRRRESQRKRFLFQSGDRVTWTGRKGTFEGIVERVKQKKSMMPEGIVGTLTASQLADLLAYLQSLK